MSLIAYAYRVSFQLATGRVVRAPARHAWLHDPSGSYWPRCSILVASFNRSGLEPDRVTSAARKWFGKDYEVEQGSVSLPSRNLSDWDEVAPAARIFYDRVGYREGAWDHGFGSAAGGLLKWITGSDVMTFKSEWPMLYRRGGAYRLELKRGCVITDRGISYP